MKIYDVIIVGGSIGGVLAAKSACEMNKKVLLIEKTKWIGGQFTNQAVPPDEHPFIESFGCTKSYRNFRENVRFFMKEKYPVKSHIKDIKWWNPGHASVSRLSADPHVFLHLFEEMLTPYIERGNLELLVEHQAIHAESALDIVKSVTIKNLKTNQIFEAKADYILDATDTGELLPMTGTEYVYGAEGYDATLEPNTLQHACPSDMQPVTWVLAMDYVKDEDHRIAKPELYDYFKSQIWPCDQTPVLSWYGPDSSTGKTKEFGMFDGRGKKLFPLWSYRRVIDPSDFEEGVFETEVTLLNWPQNDYIFGNIFESEDDVYHQERARQLTLCFFYWLQNEAPREDGGFGYPGLRLRGDIVGTEDGFAMAPYIRESRRIKAIRTITEHMMNANLQHELPVLTDSVGVGSYHIDLHMTTVNHRFFFFKTWPFEIPLSAMIPIRMKNLIPACKNIGTTQLTNGCYRLHPVEWNIGEVAGYLAACAIDWKTTPMSIALDEVLLKKFQALLDQKGIERHWPKDLVHVI